jgi:hypothetical protein
MDRVVPILRAQWKAYWRRLFRSGSAAKNDLVVLGIIAVLAAARYVPFLAEVKGNQLWYLLAAAFVAIAVSLRNDGPISAAALQRYPLTGTQRFVIRIVTAIIPPWSWIVLLFSLGIFRPLSKSVTSMAEGAAVIALALAASRIPLPSVRFRPKSKQMSLSRKEVRYVLNSSEHAFILLISLAFCAYLIGGEGLQVDAFRAVLGILSILSATAPMNTFGPDGSSGLDRYGIFGLTGSKIIGNKNLAYLKVTAVQRAPIIALAAWRLGPAEAAYGVIEATSLVLLTLAWGNIVSVRHPGPPDAEPLILDGILGFIASVLPAAMTIGILRAGTDFAALRMFAMLALCGAFYWLSLRFAGPYFMRHFDRIRSLLIT